MIAHSVNSSIGTCSFNSRVSSHHIVVLLNQTQCERALRSTYWMPIEEKQCMSLWVTHKCSIKQHIHNESCWRQILMNRLTQTLITGKKQFLMIKEAPEWWKHPFWIYYNSFKTVHVNIHFDSLANNADTSYQIKTIIIKKPVFLFHTLSRDTPSHRSVSICRASVVCLACSSRRREWELWSVLSSANESVLLIYSESDENE